MIFLSAPTLKMLPYGNCFLFTVSPITLRLTLSGGVRDSFNWSAEVPPPPASPLMRRCDVKSTNLQATAELGLILCIFCSGTVRNLILESKLFKNIYNIRCICHSKIKVKSSLFIINKQKTHLKINYTKIEVKFTNMATQ